MSSKIALVVTYFGKLPFWFPAFELSCHYNPEVKWLIFTDQVTQNHCSQNIEFVKISQHDFEKRVRSKLKININLSSKYLYKLCDYKPAYGIIYDDYLKNFDFWGHCDIDIVWGRINQFLSKTILDRYHIITSRPNRISGHFTIYRNDPKINSIFLSLPNVRSSLKESTKCMRLDEEILTNYLYWLNHHPFYPG